jgi:hypothetical protein
MSDNQSSGSSDSSSLTGFFFYTFFVYPACSWILAPKRFPRKMAILYAIGFLATLAAVKTGLELYDQGPNHYATLSVTRTTTPMEMKKAYKRLSLTLHPDKSKSETAAEDFAHLKEAYDVLISPDLKMTYDKFGPSGIEQNKSIHDEQALLFDMAIFYSTWFMLVFILTLGKASANARTWILTGGIVMLIVEITLLTTEDSLPPWFFPKTTEYEWINLLHSLFPGFMNGCRCLGGYLYVDLDQQTRNLLLALQESNKDLLLVLRDVQINVQSLGSGRVNLDSGDSAAANTNGSTTAATSGSGSGTVNNLNNAHPSRSATPTGKLRELETRIKANNSNVANTVGALKADGGKGNGLGFYGMILGYVVLQYFFSK